MQLGVKSPRYQKSRPRLGFLIFGRSAIIDRPAPRSHGPHCSRTSSVVRQMAKPRNHSCCETAGSWIRACGPPCAYGARLLRSFELSTRQSATRRDGIGHDRMKLACPRCNVKFHFPISLNWQHFVPALVAPPLTSPVRRSGLRHFDRRRLEATA